jgi:hypothetical protein
MASTKTRRVPCPKPRPWPAAPPTGTARVAVHPNVRRLRPLEPRKYRFEGWAVADRATGCVVAHMPTVVLTDVSLVVHPGGRAASVRTGIKNVHAWAVGTYLAPEMAAAGTWELVGVSYRPAADRPAAFWFSETGEPIPATRRFAAAYLDERGRMFVARDARVNPRR